MRNSFRWHRKHSKRYRKYFSFILLLFMVSLLFGCSNDTAQTNHQEADYINTAVEKNIEYQSESDDIHLNEISEFDNEPYVTINHNEPSFSKNEITKSTPLLFIIYHFLFRIYNHNALIEKRRSDITYYIILKIPRPFCYSNRYTIFFTVPDFTKTGKYAYSNYIP